MDVEVWRSIPGRPLYEASSLGRVRGLARRSRRPLYQVKNDKGYWTTKLYVGGKQCTFPVHSLVCSAFHGSKPFDRAHAAHANGDKLDNRPENLRWATAKENAADRILHGTQLRGARHGKALLTEASVLEIRRRSAAGETNTALGEEFAVCRTTITSILSGRTWSHLV